MRVLGIIILAVILVFVPLIYSGRILSSRFHVGNYRYAASVGQTPSLNESAVLNGARAALHHYGFNATNWIPVTSPDPEHPDFILKTNGQSVSALLVLTNGIDGKSLYVKAEATSDGKALTYDIYRGK